MASSNLTDAQRRLRRNLDLATDSCINYAAPEIPALANLTPQGLLEELGRLNVSRKAIEKTEKILKERLKSQLDGAKELRSDNFNMEIKVNDRNALDQTKAKAYFEAKGLLAQYMTCTSVETMTVKEN